VRSIFIFVYVFPGFKDTDSFAVSGVLAKAKPIASALCINRQTVATGCLFNCGLVELAS